MRKNKLKLLVAATFCSGIIHAQNKSFSAKIMDATTQKAISDASISGKGIPKSIYSDDLGAFTISLPSSNNILTLSAVGYKTIQVNTDTLKGFIYLYPASSAINEVVVVGYGSRMRKDITGNIATIKGTDVANTPVPQFTQAIQGRAAGVFVESQSGKVGEGIKIRIRGTGSISASNDPLYVIDGVPMNTESLAGNAMADINTDDIESFEILKDASAAAIYGSRGANGVVIITTKKGKAGKTIFSVIGQYGSSSPTHHRKFLNAEQYVTLIREAAINADTIGGVNPLDPTQYDGSNLQYVDKRLYRYSGYNDNWKTYKTNTDWESLAYNKDARTKIIDVSASGGNEKTRFYASGSFNDQDGILFSNNFKRMSGRLNVDHNASERLKLGMNMGLSRTVLNRVSIDNQFSTPMQIVALSPITPLRDTLGNYSNTPIATYYNPLIESVDARDRLTSFRSIGNAYLNYSLTKELVFRSELGVDIMNQDENIYEGYKTQVGASLNGYGSSAWYRTVNYNTNNYFNYKKNFKEKHDIDATLGMSFQDFKTDQNSVIGKDFPTENLNNLQSAGSITGGSSSSTEWSVLSYFLKVNYKFDNRYLLTVSDRIDGSSRFGANNKYGNFPAVSVGWLLNNEEFLKDSKFINLLKIRASWGLTGNTSGFGDFASRGLWTAAKYAGTSAIQPYQISNPNLKWEKSQQNDIGLDFTLLNNILSGSVDYYKKNTKDLIYNVPVPGTTGFSTQTVNIGSMENHGWEFVLNSNNIQSKKYGDFSWSSSLNISNNKNKLTKLDGAVTSVPGNDGRFLNSLIVGQPIGVFYGPKYAGVDSKNGDALYYQQDGKTTNDYNTAGNFIVGNPNPTWIAGINNNLSYKGIELSFLFQGVWGNQIMNGAGGFMSSGFDWFDNQTIDQLGRWRKPGDVTNIPQLRFSSGNGTSASSRYIQNGDYIRLKNVTLGYSLPKSLVNKLKIQGIKIFFTGVNLATITKYTGWDPEVNADYRAGNRNQGADFYSAPQIKSYTFGVNINL